MIRLPVPDKPKIQTKSYRQWKGVHFAVDESLVESDHLANIRNLVRDNSGYWEKRAGWRVLHEFEDQINGLYRLVDSTGTEHLLVHTGTSLYEWEYEGTPTQIEVTLNDQKSTAFSWNAKLYILDGLSYWCYDGTTIALVSDNAFIPTTVIGRTPAGGGGTALEAVNLLQPKRTNTFVADGTAAYQLDSTNLDAALLTANVDGVPKAETTHFTANRTTGVVTWLPGNFPPAPASAGIPTVSITFSKTTEGYADKINKCTFSASYGINNDNRIFLSGNPDFQNMDWQSGLDDPSYFPDTGYAKIGSEASAIMGYQKYGSYLMIVKEYNEQDATVYQRSGELVEAAPIFNLQQGMSGIGAIAPRTFGNLRDAPLFLSTHGIEAIVTPYMQSKNTVKNRSFFVNAELLMELNLNAAEAIVWRDYYILCVNNHCYVADSRQPVTDKGYEYTYWSNIPARVFFVDNDKLLFGTDDGKVCIFNTDMVTDQGRLTMTAFNDNGEAIEAFAYTAADDDGDCMVYKTLLPFGSGVITKPFTKSSIEVSVIDETNEILDMATSKAGLFDFSDLGFSTLTFKTSTDPEVLPLSAMIPKYIRLRFVLKNAVKDEGFGIIGIIKRYQYGTFVR